MYELSNSDNFKYTELINKLENLEINFSLTEFDWLKSNNRTYYCGGEDFQFHYFVYCLNWNELYCETDEKLTIYDIIILDSSTTFNIRKEKFRIAYEGIKKLFNGDFKNPNKIEVNRKTILSKLSEGLGIKFNNKAQKSKGLNEFFKMVFDKLADVNFNFSDFSQPYLEDEYQRSRFLIDLFHKFLPAYDVATIFNIEFRTQIRDVEINPFFVLHVLLRHSNIFKFHYLFKENTDFETFLIKNGVNKNVKITAHKNLDGNIYNISKDGIFYLPEFSIDEDHYITFLNNGGKIKIYETAKYLFEKLKILIPIFTINLNSNLSPNIIYCENGLYGFEFSKWRYKSEGVIELGSFYPLNSEDQLTNGISKLEYEMIINKQDIPNEMKSNLKF